MATTHEIQKFIDAFQGGTRPNRFRIQCVGPGGQSLFETHCQASSLPDATIGQIPINFRGRIYNFPGDRVYQQWSVTVIDDVLGKNSWDYMHQWHNTINSHGVNVTGDRTHRTNYATILRVQLLDHNSTADKVLRSYDLQNAYPVSVGQITLDQNTPNTLTTFAVNFSYTHYTPTTQLFGELAV